MQSYKNAPATYIVVTTRSYPMRPLLTIALLAILTTSASPQSTPAPNPARPTPPTRDPNTAGYVTAKELPDGAIPPANADGNFIIGPTHNPAPEMTAQQGVPQGTVFNFTMNSTDSKIYPGIAREPNTFGTPDPDRSRQTDRHHQPPRSLHAQRRRLRPQTIRPRHRRAVHRRRRRPRPHCSSPRSTI